MVKNTFKCVVYLIGVCFQESYSFNYAEFVLNSYAPRQLICDLFTIYWLQSFILTPCTFCKCGAPWRWLVVIAEIWLEYFLTFCWPCISVYLSQYLTNLMHKICFTVSFISFLYMFLAHVLIIRRSKSHYTYRCDDTRGCVMRFWPSDDEHMCSKHVEEWNKTYCETNFVHQVG